MPSFVLSFALLLLVLLTLLAVSNRELIALTFLGVSTVALPLSVWILGAIAVGFILGLWILLLFRFGTVGVGSGNPFRDKRRANYGPEDFAVVNDRFADSQAAPVYRDGRYEDNRYDDIYGRGQHEDRSEANLGDTDRYGQDYEPAADRYDTGGGYGTGYDTGYDNTGYNSGRDEAAERSYAADSYERDRAEPQDRFSASAGYDRTGVSGGAASSPADATGKDDPSPAAQSTQSAAADPAMPQDWDDQYREDWTEEELSAQPEPVLRNQNPAPKLKRWLNPNGEERPRLNLGGFGLGETKASRDPEAEQPDAVEAKAGSDYSQDYRGDESDWQAARGYGDGPGGDRGGYESNRYDSAPDANSREVYDADYRVVRKPEEEPGIANPEPADRSRQSVSRPMGEPNTPPPESKPEPKRGERGGKDDWDIDSDLGW